jgi:hypothetical protein
MACAAIDVVLFAVIWQNGYEVKVEDQALAPGNVAVFECHVPKYAREDVTVTSWFLPNKDNRNVFPTSADYQGEFCLLQLKELYMML